MTIFESILLGAVQGLTEFIPVSSSGHLVLAEHVFGIETPYVFSALINLGTFLALVIYFRTRLASMYNDIVHGKNYALARNIIISAVPVGVLGFFFEDFFEQGFIQHPLVVAIMLALLGIIMIVIEKLPKRSALRKADDLSPNRAWTIGLAQALALLPGTSRSGSTMIAGRFMGLNYKQAAEYSFLLSIPVIFGVLLKAMLSSDGVAFIAAQPVAFLVSNLVAFVTGLFAVGFMLRYLAHGNFAIFGWYRLALASVIIVVLLL